MIWHNERRSQTQREEDTQNGDNDETREEEEHKEALVVKDRTERK